MDENNKDTQVNKIAEVSGEIGVKFSATNKVAKASAAVAALGGLVGTGVGLAAGSPVILGAAALSVAGASLVQISSDKTRTK